MGFDLSDFSDVIKGLMVGGSAMQTISAYKGAQADKSAFKYQATVDENNAILADQQRADAIRNGQIEAVNASMKAGQLEGKQRAAFSQANLDTSQGSPLNILSDTLFLGRRDAGIIMDNANKKARGYDVMAGNDRANAKLLRDRADDTDPWRTGLTTLLTSGGTVASKWYAMDKASEYLG